MGCTLVHMRGLARTDLAVIIPSTGRAEQCARLVERIHETSRGAVSDIIVSVESEDLQAYMSALLAAGDSVKIVTPEYAPETRSHVAAMNRGVRWLVGQAPFDDDLVDTYPVMIVKMDDDHWPVTIGWDVQYLNALATLGGTGVVYGNDLFQGERLPTVPGISTNIVRELGWYAPPQLQHWHCDDFWRELGQRSGRLLYLQDTIIEHRHPQAGKAQRDAVYAAGGENAERIAADGRAWHKILADHSAEGGTGWPSQMGKWAGTVRRLAEQQPWPHAGSPR